MGVSEHRSFGVCELSANFRCRESDHAGTVSLLDLCAHLQGEPCACLVPSPLPAGVTERFGFIVHRSLCLAYREHFPDNADCYEGAWSRIP